MSRRVIRMLALVAGFVTGSILFLLQDRHSRGGVRVGVTHVVQVQVNKSRQRQDPTVKDLRNELVFRDKLVFADDDLDEDNSPPAYKTLANLNTLPRTTGYSYEIELDPKKKYIMYNPSGGFNNQLLTLMQVAAYAKMIGRAILVSPNAKHMDGAINFMHSTNNQVVPMDQCLDLQYLSKKWGVELVPLGYSQKHCIDMIKAKPGVTFKPYRVDKNTTYSEYLEIGKELVLKNAPQVAFLRGHVYAGMPLVHPIGTIVRYSPFFDEIARAVREHVLGDEYTAMHIRLLYFVRGRTSRTYRFVAGAEKTNVNFSRPLYIAMDGTREEDGKHLKQILSRFKTVYFREDLKKHPVVAALINKFDSAFRGFVDPEFREDVFGLVEQLICAHSTKYIGTAHSTFSKNIMAMRRGFNYLNPYFTSWENLNKISPGEKPGNKVCRFSTALVNHDPVPRSTYIDCPDGTYAPKRVRMLRYYNPYLDPPEESPFYNKYRKN
uniref:GDP-fucose protein O-fucosyltransferase 2 n=1 Tax=Mucochytrium quahogii TaxID=96639 RepID=A0A7S2RHH6_9STRA|mmetsp:Transcript_43597/g.69721  ORF Transcript_43597/g.69721 Transcript_43597/m.69721 type:complete len:492 (+) Transcript_43597:271-1746(+)